MNTLYRIVSYFLLVVAVILGIAALFTLLIALANPALLISVFVVVAVVLYSISSFLFLHNGIDGKQKLKMKLRDFIKVNAFVSLFVVVSSIAQFLVMIFNPSLADNALKETAQVQQEFFKVPIGVSILIQKISIWLVFIYSVALAYHIYATFRYLKQYATLFDEQPKGN